MASIINASTSSGLVTTADTSGVLQLQSNGTTAITVDSSQNVGVGTTSPSTKLAVSVGTGGSTTGISTTGSGNMLNTFPSSSTNAGVILDATDGTVGSSTAVPMIFRGGGTERMRIDSSGNIGIGTTGTTARLEVYKSDSVGQCSLFLNNPDAQGTGTRLSFRQTSEQAYLSSLYSGGWNLYARSGSSGGVVLAANATSWTSTSDERLKNITGTYSNALADIAQIQPVKFTWKSDETNTPQVGVIAQSVEAVVPEAVTSCKMIESDDTEYLGVRYTELIPLMIASIQELKAELDATKAEVATAQAEILALKGTV